MQTQARLPKIYLMLTSVLLLALSFFVLPAQIATAQEGETPTTTETETPVASPSETSTPTSAPTETATAIAVPTETSTPDCASLVFRPVYFYQAGKPIIYTGVLNGTSEIINLTGVYFDWGPYHQINPGQVLDQWYFHNFFDHTNRSMPPLSLSLPWLPELTINPNTVGTFRFDFLYNDPDWPGNIENQDFFLEAHFSNGCSVYTTLHFVPTPTRTPSRTPTMTRTPTFTRTPSRTPTITRTPTFTRTPTNTFTPSKTPTITNTPWPTYTRTKTPTPSKTFTPSMTPSQTRTPLPPSNTPTPSMTPSPTWTPTDTSTVLPTSTPWDTPVPTETPTEIFTPTP